MVKCTAISANTAATVHMLDGCVGLIPRRENGCHRLKTQDIDFMIKFHKGRKCIGYDPDFVKELYTAMRS